MYQRKIKRKIVWRNNSHSDKSQGRMILPICEGEECSLSQTLLYIDSQLLCRYSWVLEIHLCKKAHGIINTTCQMWVSHCRSWLQHAYRHTHLFFQHAVNLACRKWCCSCPGSVVKPPSQVVNQLIVQSFADASLYRWQANAHPTTFQKNSLQVPKSNNQQKQCLCR